MRPDWWVWFNNNQTWIVFGWELLKAGGVVGLLAYLGHPALRAKGSAQPLLAVSRRSGDDTR